MKKYTVDIIDMAKRASFWIGAIITAYLVQLATTKGQFATMQPYAIFIGSLILFIVVTTVVEHLYEYIFVKK